jgi:carboxymethylenebutenolidase
VCFDLDSSPPIARIAGAAVDHRDLTLTSADGTEFAGFEARPSSPPRAAVVVLPDVRGLYRFYEELALRFAERGIVAVVIDYFGRTAGVAKRGEDFDYMQHVQRLDPADVQRDLGAAVAHLRTHVAGQDVPVFTVGFCFGGRQSWLAAASGHGLAGAVGFYGMPGERNGQPGPTQRVVELKAPILALQGGADAHITADVNEEFDRALTAAGVEHELITYPGAPHSFFDRKQEEFADASEDAWRRVLEFIDRHSVAQPPVAPSPQFN